MAANTDKETSYSPSEEGKEMISIRAALGMNKADFARALSVERYQVRNWEIGSSQKVPSDVLNRARKLLPNRSSLHPYSENFGKLVKVKPIGRAAAGEGESYFDPDEDYQLIPEFLNKPTNIIFVITGDSGMPYLQHGDVGVFKQTTDKVAGLTYLVKSHDGYRVKCLVWKDGEWWLESFNKTYEAFPLGENQIQGYLAHRYRVEGFDEDLKSNANGIRFVKML